MSPAALIRFARVLIGDPARWIDPAVMPTGDAVLSDGVTYVPPTSREAVRLSGYGALVRASRHARTAEVSAAYAALDHAVAAPFREWCRAPCRTHAEVLAAMDQAIAETDIVTGFILAGRR